MLNYKQVSEEAYWHCRYVDDNPGVRKYIIDNDYAYRYCRWVKDDPEVRKYIVDPKRLDDYAFFFEMNIPI